MFSSLLFALTILGQAWPTMAQDKQDPPPKPIPTLKIGDSAPALKVSKWYQGDEVKTFEPGKVYVVEFWATWCGPCIGAMPHLSALQAEYAERGVTIIGFTSRDILGKPDHPEKGVDEFMGRKGKKFGYRFAYSDDDFTVKNWMSAAGREGIPCSFVVDREGKIAYIGHPMYLPAVLPLATEGTLSAVEIGSEIGKIEDEFRTISAKIFREPKTSLQELKAFEAKHSKLTDFLVSIRIKLSLLPKHGESGEAATYATALLEKASKSKDFQTLGMISALLRRGDGKESKQLLEISVRAAETVVKMDGGKEAGSLIDLADAHFLSGNKFKAKEYALQAREAAKGKNDAFREYIAKEATRLGAE
ncbi:MAG: TlpA disulfide reductase family protein [Fimbriiglobus sp.]